MKTSIYIKYNKNGQYEIRTKSYRTSYKLANHFILYYTPNFEWQREKEILIRAIENNNKEKLFRKLRRHYHVIFEE